MSGRLLVVLQNAYDKGGLAAGWHPARWREELRTSLTGKRLAHALPIGAGWSVRFANACPGIGSGPDSKLAPCRRHVLRAIRRVEPAVILACGRTAEAAVAAAWGGPLFAIPHPACRIVTTELLARCALAIQAWSVHPRRDHGVPRLAYRLDRRERAGRLVRLARTPEKPSERPDRDLSVLRLRRVSRRLR